VGTPPTVYPEGMGRWVRKGQTLRTNLHYHPNGKPQVDRTRIGLYFGKGELKKEVVAALAGTFNLSIPPQAQNHEIRSAYVAEQDINVVSLFPHMHLRGKDMKLTASYSGGRQETILNVPAYDFNWQLFYYPRSPITLPKGTRIDLVAHFDNSSANPRNPDPTRTVTFGEASTAEMMFGMFEFTAVDGVSPKAGSVPSRMEALMASFPKGAAYGITISQGPQTIPTVLYLPNSGDPAWYFLQQGLLNVASVTDLKWSGSSFKFSVSGLGPGPMGIAGELKDDGSIHGAVELATAAGRIPFVEFSGTSN
jgi:hypothetical protein